MLITLTWAALNVKPDLIHYSTSGDRSFVSDFLNLLLLKITGHLVLLHYHADPTSPITEFPCSRSRNWKNIVFVGGLRLTNLFVTLGDKYCAFLRERFAVAPSKVTSLHNTFVPEYFSSDVEIKHAQRSIDHSHLRVLFVGRIGFLKGFFDLLEVARLSAKKNLNIVYMVAGPFNSAEEKAKAYQMMSLYSLSNVRLLGELRASDKERVFLESDVLFSPSHYEGFPISYLEAAYYGLPCIVYNIGMNADIVEDAKTGFVVEKGRIGSVVSILGDLSRDRSRIEKLGEAAGKTLHERFSPVSFEQKLSTLYNNVLERAR
jgi:glycosyltransferase involved in cell wall biosynthesis